MRKPLGFKRPSRNIRSLLRVRDSKIGPRNELSAQCLDATADQAEALGYTAVLRARHRAGSGRTWTFYMSRNWMRPWYCFDPDFRENLLERLRHWLDDTEASDALSLSRPEIETAAAAIEESLRRLPVLERRLEKLLEEDALAFRAIKETKGREGRYKALRIKGWIAEKGKKTKMYPPELTIEYQYVALTTTEGQFTFADEVAERFKEEHRFLTFDVECPLEPMEAVTVLARVHRAANRLAMLRELWRRYKEIERRRQALLDAGDAEAASSLPDLSTLPQSREVE